MAGKIIYAILLLGTLALAAQVAIVLIFAVLLAGLIFRTKQTIGLLLVGGFFSALAAAPVITLGVVASLVTISLIFKAKEKAASVTALEQQDPEPENT